jgi:hypothetical protein
MVFVLPVIAQWFKEANAEAQELDDEIMRDRNYEPISPAEMATWVIRDLNAKLGPGDSRDVFDDDPDITGSDYAGGDGK